MTTMIEKNCWNEMKVGCASGAKQKAIKFMKFGESKWNEWFVFCGCAVMGLPARRCREGRANQTKQTTNETNEMKKQEVF